MMTTSMKYVLFVICPFLVVGCANEAACKKGSKNATEVNIQLENFTEGNYVIERRYAREREAIDTAVIDENGKVQFLIDVKGTQIYSVKHLEHSDEIILIASQNEKIDITGDAGNLAKSFVLSGTKENEAFQSYINIERDFQQFTDSLKQVWSKLQMKQQHFLVEKEFNQLLKDRSEQHFEKIKSFIDKHEDYFVNMLVVRSLNVKDYPDYYKKVSESLGEKFPDSEHVEQFVTDVTRMVATEVGGMAPEIKMLDQNGAQFSLSSLKGNYVLLDFWATWCRPCLKEIPNLKRVKERFSHENFEIVSVCIDRTEFKENWGNIIQQHDCNWPQLFDATGVSAKDYAIQYFPTIFLLDPQGQIIAKNIRGPQISDKLDEIFVND